MLEVSEVDVDYRLGGGLLRPATVVHAVHGVTLTVDPGEALGVVGESGCGKSSLARAVSGLVPIAGGSVRVGGRPLEGRRSRDEARLVQLVFQDPTASLNPRRRVGSVLRELLELHGLASGAAADRRVGELLELVGLPGSAAQRFPAEFSGGQRQRIGIARALAVEPQVLVADEAVSALDLSTQGRVLRLLDQLRRDLGLALVFISHDLGVVRALCDRVAVMYLGTIVEQGPTADLFAAAQHPYTQALLRAVPRIGDPRAPGTSRLPGEPPSPLTAPSGCVFHPRCVLAEERCAQSVPPLLRIGDRDVACHLVPGTTEGADA